MRELAHVLRHLTPVDDVNALVHSATGDDAAVYRLTEDRALVITVDFFTPIVDDPFDFGRIGAANALSDVYAMGARPLLALNLVGFPRSLLEEGMLEDILRGGAHVLSEAGVPLLGGHSIDDREPKFGMVAVGEVHPDRVITNAGALPGDRLFLTKPLGTGVVSTAVKAGAAPDAVVRRAIECMTRLNREAAHAMIAAGVNAATDITGFGLLGHLRNLLRQSGVAAQIRSGAVPILAGAEELAVAGHVPGGTRRNLEDLGPDVVFGEGVAETTRLLLADAQTSGGLVISASESAATTLQRALGAEAHEIGSVIEGPAGRIEIS